LTNGNQDPHHRNVRRRNPHLMGGMTGVGYGELVAAVANAGALGFITAHMFPKRAGAV
jgi:NAD(P)H-dependent flavin oxidoreductase YrpB (nitropropane dioxygenase family)